MSPLSPAETARFFRASELFATLPDHEVEALSDHARHEDFEAGDMIFALESRGDRFYWTTRGRVKLTTTSPSGSELLHVTVGPGEHFGEVSPIDAQPRGVNAVADAASSVVSLHRDVVLPVLERHPKAALHIATLLCRQIRVAGDTLRNLALNNAEQKIWTRLMTVANGHGRVDSDSGTLRIAHGMSQEDLGATVGLTRVKVNRQLNAWKQQSLVTFGRGYIEIPDVEALRAAVWGHAPDSSR